MRKLLLGCALLATVATGCKKESSNGGKITLVNNSNNGYRIEKNGSSFATVAGKSSDTKDMEVGTFQFVATQLEGYVLYPTVVKKTIEVKSGSTATFAFP